MRTRFWGLVLVALWLAVEAAPARAAIWPFSLFATNKVPVKRHKPKTGRPRPGAWPRPGYGR